jgi:hypothetical protein
MLIEKRLKRMLIVYLGAESGSCADMKSFDQNDVSDQDGDGRVAGGRWKTAR